MRPLHRFVVASALLISGPVFASELTPYPPPVQQVAPPKAQGRFTQQPARAPESIYLRFEREVRTLPPNERQALTRSFEQRRAQAARAGDLARELHYLRLLDVLRGGQR